MAVAVAAAATTAVVEDIPHVGPGTPAGEWFRRYWLVVGTTQDLHDIPQAVKVLGEELVLFRDDVGKLGLLGLHCPHRGTSLEYGDIEDGGLRCPYHGWLFNVAGQCLEMPAEPKDSKFPQKVKHLSYPVQELGGLIFAYMGEDRENPPPLPRYSPLIDRGGQRQVEHVRHCDYNWFNFFENSADPAHIEKVETDVTVEAGPNGIADGEIAIDAAPDGFALGAHRDRLLDLERLVGLDLDGAAEQQDLFPGRGRRGRCREEQQACQQPGSRARAHQFPNSTCGTARSCSSSSSKYSALRKPKELATRLLGKDSTMTLRFLTAPL